MYKPKKKPLIFAAALLGAAACQLSFAPKAGAASIPVTNFSFENGVTGWTSTAGANGSELASGAGVTPADGADVGFTYNYEPDETAEMTQVLMDSMGHAMTTVAGETYTLLVSIGPGHAYGGAAPTGNIALLDNGFAIASLTGIVDPYPNGMQDYTVHFTAAVSGDFLSIQLGQDASASVDADSSVSFDDVRLMGVLGVVPEPSSLALAVGGLGAFALLRLLRRTCK